MFVRMVCEEKLEEVKNGTSSQKRYAITHASDGCKHLELPWQYPIIDIVTSSERAKEIIYF